MASGTTKFCNSPLYHVAELQGSGGGAGVSLSKSVRGGPVASSATDSAARPGKVNNGLRGISISVPDQINSEVENLNTIFVAEPTRRSRGKGKEYLEYHAMVRSVKCVGPLPEEVGNAMRYK